MSSSESRLPPRTSYTQISTAQRCAFRYWLKYVMGVTPVTRSRGLMRGSLLHEAYDEYMFLGRPSHEAAHHKVELMAQREVDAGADPSMVDEVVEEAHNVLDHYLPWADEHDNWELYIPDGQQQCETSGEYPLTATDVDGSLIEKPIFFKIDALIKIDGHLYMLENKFRKNLDSNGLEHDLQILLYQACWNALHPHNRIEGVLYNIVGAKPRKKDKAIAVREHYYRGPTEEAVAFRIASATLTNLQMQEAANSWPMHLQKSCSWDCDYSGMCMGIRAGASLDEYIESGQYKLRK